MHSSPNPSTCVTEILTCSTALPKYLPPNHYFLAMGRSSALTHQPRPPHHHTVVPRPPPSGSLTFLSRRDTATSGRVERRTDTSDGDSHPPGHGRPDGAAGRGAERRPASQRDARVTTGRHGPAQANTGREPTQSHTVAYSSVQANRHAGRYVHYRSMGGRTDKQGQRGHPTAASPYIRFRTGKRDESDQHRQLAHRDLRRAQPHRGAKPAQGQN